MLEPYWLFQLYVLTSTYPTMLFIINYKNFHIRMLLREIQSFYVDYLKSTANEFIEKKDDSTFLNSIILFLFFLLSISFCI